MVPILHASMVSFHGYLGVPARNRRVLRRSEGGWLAKAGLIEMNGKKNRGHAVCCRGHPTSYLCISGLYSTIQAIQGDSREEIALRPSEFDPPNFKCGFLAILAIFYLDPKNKHWKTYHVKISRSPKYRVLDLLNSFRLSQLSGQSDKTSKSYVENSESTRFARVP